MSICTNKNKGITGKQILVRNNNFGGVGNRINTSILKICHTSVSSQTQVNKNPIILNVKPLNSTISTSKSTNVNLDLSKINSNSNNTIVSLSSTKPIQTDECLLNDSYCESSTMGDSKDVTSNEISTDQSLVNTNLVVPTNLSSLPNSNGDHSSSISDFGENPLLMFSVLSYLPPPSSIEKKNIDSNMDCSDDDELNDANNSSFDYECKNSSIKRKRYF